MQSNERKTDPSLSSFYTLINIEKIKLTFHESMDYSYISDMVHHVHVSYSSYSF